MTSKPPRRKGGAFSGNHQRSWLWGHHGVYETLKANRWPVMEVFVTQPCFDQFAAILKSRMQAGLRVDIVPASRLEELAKTTDHQGIIARLGPFPYQTMHELETTLRERLQAPQPLPGKTNSTWRPLIVLCDRIQDAFNFGAVLRCCDGANVLGVIVGDKSQAEVTPHVARASSGAINHLCIVRTEDLLEAANRLRKLGLQLVAADANAQQSMWETPMNMPTVLILGSEAHGIAPPLLDQCDQRVVIPMHGGVTSLNAAVAAGIMLYEIRRQQSQSIRFSNPSEPSS